MLVIEAAAERSKRAIERDRLLAYNTAALAGLAFVGKLKSLSESFGSDEERQDTPGSMKVLGLLLKMRRNGIPMEIEKVTRH